LRRTLSTPHSSKSARLASEAFYFVINKIIVQHI
jgi:hypothetical protein